MKPNALFDRRIDFARLVLAIVVLFGLTCFLYPSRMPITRLWYDHGDTLVFEGIARDLWRGGSLLDWRLPQAPSLFPDIALTTLLAPWLPLGSAAVWIQAIYGVLGAWGWWRLSRRIGATGSLPVLAPLAYSSVFLSSVLATSLSSSVALYFGLSGHHSSIAAMTPFALLALLELWRSVQVDAHSRIAPVLASLTLLFLLAISDELYVLGLLVPVAALLTASLFRPAGSGRRAAVVAFVALMAILVIISMMAGKMLVFDSREWFVHWTMMRFLDGFPTVTLDSIRAFMSFLHESWFTGLLMLAWAMALAFASIRASALLLGLKAAVPTDDHDKVGEQLVLLAAICGGLVVILADVLLGVFSAADHSRHFAGFLISALTLAPLLLALEGRRWPRVVVPGAAACLVTVYWFTMLALPRVAYVQRYAEVVRCLDKEFPRGVDFVADFWVKVPIDFWSQGRFRGVVSTPGSVAAFTNGQNVLRTRDVRPTVALVDRGQAYADFYRMFLDANGAPKRTVQCPFGVVALDYSDNAAFTERHAAAAKAAQ